MNKENKFVLPQSSRYLMAPQLVRSRNYSAPSNLPHHAHKKTLTTTCLAELCLEKRPALNDLQPNVSSNVSNLKRWLGKESELNDIATPTNANVKVNERDGGTYYITTTYLQRNGSAFTQTNTTTTKCILSGGTPVYISTTEAGTLRINPTVNRKFVTVRRSLTPLNGVSDAEHLDYYDDVDDDVFIDAQQVFGRISPIMRNYHTAEDTILIPTAARKPKSSIVKKKNNKQQLNARYIYVDNYKYNTTYLEDMIDNTLNKDLKHVVPVHMLKSKDINVQGRAAIVDWLLKIQMQFQLTSEIYLQSVRFFDCILGSCEVPLNMYQLIASAALWIIAKYNDSVVYMSAKKIVLLTGNAYDERQLLNMELKLLKYINYNCNINDPIIFAEYYVFRANIQQKKEILSASYYLLESFALSPYFSTVPSSLLAASAVYLSMEYLGISTQAWEELHHYRAYYHIQYISAIRSRMAKVLQRILTTNFPYTECFNKYNTPEHNFISKTLSKFSR